MKLRPRKRVRSSKDEIIVNILSCMPTRDAVRTVLLRCFRNLWTLVHSLKFYLDEYTSNYPRRKQWFCSFVHNVLIRHGKLSIDRIHLCIEPEPTASYLGVWLRSALDRQAKEIRLSKFNNIFTGRLYLNALPYRNHPLSLNVPNLRSLYLEFDVSLLNIIDVSSVCDFYIKYSTFRMNDDEVVAINQILLEKLQELPPFNTIGGNLGYWKSWTSQLQLIEFLLKSAANLDKLIIIPSMKPLKEAEELEFVNHISSFERSSPTVRVIFS
ncbi:putative FBD-associated F-box protein At5g56560 [Silene latifolia]|uniref:putative FBD-associated F-box protein At5g56560 n=1 Tax=Silene latifolia TaxID=37657 RepID=UPI003D77FC74